MKRLEAWLYGALLVVTLAVAWGVKNAEEPEEETSSVVFDPGAAGLQSLQWEDERSVATIEVTGTGDDRSTWVVAGRKERIVAGDDDDSAGDDDDSAGDDDDSAEAEVTYGAPKLRRFPGNATAGKLVDSFSPLAALREWTGLEADAIEQMGLDEPAGTLVVTGGGKTVTLEIGEKAYGSSDTYARMKGSDRVFLLSSKDLSPLRGAENRLVERTLLDTEEADLVEATVLVDGAPVAGKYTHEGRHDKANSFWAPEGSPEDRDTVFGGFVEKALGLRASSYATDDEALTADDVEVVLEVRFSTEDGETVALRLGRTEAERSTDEEPVWDYWANGPLSRDQWPKVSRATAGELVDQLESIRD